MDIFELIIKVLDPKEIPRTASGGSVQSQTSQGRSHDEKDTCLELDDNICIVTGKPHPLVCHIIPFSWCKTVTRQTIIKSLRAVIARYLGLSQDLSTEMTLDSLVANPGSSDRTQQS